MNLYSILWPSNRQEIVKGYSIENAMERAGYNVDDIDRLLGWSEV